MNGAIYKKLRKEEKREERVKKIAIEYQNLKSELIDKFADYIDTDNLFTLSRVIKLSLKVLKREEFPIKLYEKRKK